MAGMFSRRVCDALKYHKILYVTERNSGKPPPDWQEQAECCWCMTQKLIHYKPGLRDEIMQALTAFGVLATPSREIPLTIIVIKVSDVNPFKKPPRLNRKGFLVKR